MGNKPKIGAHLSCAGGYVNALYKARDIGANCVQIFSNSPRMWKARNSAPEQDEQFILLKNDLGINPIYFHAPYLINLADTGRTGILSQEFLIQELLLSDKLGIKGTIVHLGSFKNKLGTDTQINAGKGRHELWDALITQIKRVLEMTPPDTLFIIENSGNKKIGSDFDEIAGIIKDVDNERVRVCYDTCHGHAAGYDLSTKENFNAFLEVFDQKIGLEKLELFQINDSKDYLGSFRDRHENIGKGKIPLNVFTLLLNDERTKEKAFILEVPGQEKKGPDRENINLLKSMRNV